MSSLTPESFRRALDRGMGRAALCVVENDPAPYVPELIRGCLADGSFHISEVGRAPYLARVTELARAEEAVNDALLAALPTEDDTEDDLRQRLGLLAEFTKRGDPRAKTALLARALQDDEAVSALASLGAPALRWLIASRPELFFADRFEDAWYWIFLAEEASGKEAVEAVLPESLREVKRAWDLREPEVDETPLITDVAELLRRFEDPASERERRRLAGRFGMQASPENLRVWAKRMLAETDPKTLDAMSAAFSNQPWPLDARPILTRIDAGDRSSDAWRRVLGEAQGPEVREFALARLGMDPPDEDALAFLRGNFIDGDEAVILEALRRIDPDEEGICHSLGVDLRALADERGAERFVTHLEWSIEHNPCSFCRNGAMELLLKAGALSEAYQREAVYDAESDAWPLDANAP